MLAVCVPAVLTEPMLDNALLAWSPAAIVVGILAAEVHKRRCLGL